MKYQTTIQIAAGERRFVQVLIPFFCRFHASPVTRDVTFPANGVPTRNRAAVPGGVFSSRFLESGLSTRASTPIEPVKERLAWQALASSLVTEHTPEVSSVTKHLALAFQANRVQHQPLCKPLGSEASD